MGVVRTRRVTGRRKSVKAQRPWSRTVRNYKVGRPVRTLATVRPVMGVYGLGQSFRTKLKYVDNVGLSSVGGAVSKNVFSPQNCYDPNVTGTGHQPMYFDQLAAVFNKYKVHSAKITVSFNAVTETAATSCFACGIIGGSGQSILADPNGNMEDNHGVSTIVNGRNGNSGQKTLFLTYAPMRDLGITVNDDTLTSDVTTGAGTYFWNVWCADLQSTGTTNMVASVIIEFDVEFTDNKNISQS